MNATLEVILLSLLSVVLTGLLIYLIVVAWKQDIDAARRILLATTVVVGVGALASIGYTVYRVVTLRKNKQEKQMMQQYYGTA